MREFDALLRRRKSQQEAEMYRSAFIVSSIYNVNRDTKRHPEPFRPEDFMGRERKRQSSEDMMAAARNIAASFGGKLPEG